MGKQPLQTWTYVHVFRIKFKVKNQHIVIIKTGYSKHALHIISTLDYDTHDTNSLYTIITIKKFAVLQSLQNSTGDNDTQEQLSDRHTFQICKSHMFTFQASNLSKQTSCWPIAKFANDLQPSCSGAEPPQAGTSTNSPGAISHSTLIAPQIAVISLHKMKGAFPTDHVFAGAIRRVWGTFCHVCWARSLCQEEPQPTRPNHTFMPRQLGSRE